MTPPKTITSTFNKVKKTNLDRPIIIDDLTVHTWALIETRKENEFLIACDRKHKHQFISEYLPKLSTKVFDEKIGVSKIRSIYETNFIKNFPIQPFPSDVREVVAHRLGHTPQAALKYYDRKIVRMDNQTETESDIESTESNNETESDVTKLLQTRNYVKQNPEINSCVIDFNGLIVTVSR